MNAGGRTLLALDVDGVLLDSDRAGRGPWQVAFGEHFAVDAGLLDDTLFSTTWTEVVVGRLPVELALAQAFGALGWTMSVEEALECWFEQDFVLHPAVVAAATSWSDRGVPLALVSNQEPRRARYLRERLGQVLPLHGVAFSGDLGLVKSDAAFYGRAEQRLGVAGNGWSVVFLDDTVTNVEAAEQHGWAGILFTGDTDWRGAVEAALGRAADPPGAV